MKKIVMLSLARFDDVNTSTTFELAQEFSKSSDVLIVEHPYTWSEMLRSLSKRKGWIRLLATLFPKPLIRAKGRVTVLVPPAVLPINFMSFGKGYAKLSMLNHRLVANGVNKYLLGNEWKEYYYVNSYNYHFPNLSAHLVGLKLKNVYHCVDPIVKPYTRKHGIRNQQSAVKNADLVVSTAPQLQRAWESTRPSIMIPNGVNYRHFDAPQKYAPQIRSLGKKIVGYFGAIERRIDFDMLIASFKANPDWTLVMAGPVEAAYIPAEFYAMPNVHLIGKYTYAELPSLIYSIDATIIPFKIEPSLKSIYPLKLYEYMSTGKPIVCTMFNEDLLVPISDKVYISNAPEDLGSAIEAALEESDIVLQLSRRAFASLNTWEHRAKKFLDHLTNEKDVQTEASL